MKRTEIVENNYGSWLIKYDEETNTTIYTMSAIYLGAIYWSFIES